MVEPKTFVCAETHVAVTQALKDSITVGQGRIEVVTEPNAVVEVDDNCDPQEAGHGGVHEALEDGRGVVPTKWKDREAVRPSCVTKPKRSRESGWTRSCQKPLYRSLAHMYLVPDSLSKMSAIFGRG